MSIRIEWSKLCEWQSHEAELAIWLDVMIVAVIPARGGSKRIPRKNIRHFAGKPIIAYSIAAAQECGLFDRIIVSTDDAEIKSVAESFGAEVPFVRAPDLSGDFVGTNEVIADALAWLANSNHKIDIACGLYATAPFVTANDLHRGYDLLISSKYSFVFSAAKFEFPVQRAIRHLEANGVVPFLPEFIDARSQDLEELYHDAGQFYWGRVEAFRSGLPIFSPHSSIVVLPRYRAIDIDTLEDWTQAELMYEALAAWKIVARS
jgi:pseudaminic acid cytidylyltransferase